MTKARATRVPECWPRGMRADLAAAYVGLSRSAWDREWKSGQAPKPVELTPGVQVWLREHLDAWLDRRAGIATPSGDGSEWLEAIDG